jgi:hypothetical protein
MLTIKSLIAIEVLIIVKIITFISFETSFQNKTWHDTIYINEKIRM